MKKLSVLVVSLGLLAGCATVLEGQTQPIKIVTPGAEYAECHLTNKDLRYVVKAGQTRTINKSRHDLTVECLAEGNRKRTVVVESQLEPATLANVTNGVAPGVTYDHISNGMFAYPEVITVDFNGVPASAYPLPDYMRPELRNTYVGEIERYGSDRQATRDDINNPPRAIQKYSGPRLTDNPFSNLGTGAGAAAPAPLLPVTEK